METNYQNISLDALKVAVTQVGMKEDPIGSNWGKVVQGYLKCVGLTAPAAWCQAFAYWCYEKASLNAACKNPMVKTAGVLDCWHKTAENLKLHATEALARPDLVSAGDQIIFKHAAGTGHTGIVECIERGADGIWMAHTIEGNTNHDGSREGYEVERKLRKLTDPHLVGFICYHKKADDQPTI